MHNHSGITQHDCIGIAVLPNLTPNAQLVTLKSFVLMLEGPNTHVANYVKNIDQSCLTLPQSIFHMHQKTKMLGKSYLKLLPKQSVRVSVKTTNLSDSYFVTAIVICIFIILQHPKKCIHTTQTCLGVAAQQCKKNSQNQEPQ